MRRLTILVLILAGFVGFLFSDVLQNGGWAVCLGRSRSRLSSRRPARKIIQLTEPKLTGPVSLEEALARWTPGQVGNALEDLAVSGRAQVVERHGVRFWSGVPSFYPDETSSSRTNPKAGNRRETDVLEDS